MRRDMDCWARETCPWNAHTDHFRKLSQVGTSSGSQQAAALINDLDFYDLIPYPTT